MKGKRADDTATMGADHAGGLWMGSGPGLEPELRLRLDKLQLMISTAKKTCNTGNRCCR
jgi:hypothetical protein